MRSGISTGPTQTRSGCGAGREGGRQVRSQTREPGDDWKLELLQEGEEKLQDLIGSAIALCYTMRCAAASVR
jgi:hypothetical protein